MLELVLGAGFQSVYTSIVNDWLGPVYLLVVGVCAITFIKNQEFRKLLSYVGIATVVALLIYAGQFLFQGEDQGALTKAGKGIVQKVN